MSNVETEKSENLALKFQVIDAMSSDLSHSLEKAPLLGDSSDNNRIENADATLPFHALQESSRPSIASLRASSRSSLLTTTFQQMNDLAFAEIKRNNGKEVLGKKKLLQYDSSVR